MLIDIEKLPKEGLKLSKDFDFMSMDLVEENTVFLQPTHAEVFIKRVGDEIQLQGRISTCLSFICSRCLSPFEFPVNSKFDLIYLPEELNVPKEGLEDEDIDKLYYFSQHLDLREVILEQLNLTFPMKPLCSEDCEGICAVCGKVRKDNQCDCIERKPDSRLEKLKSFIRDKR